MTHDFDDCLLRSHEAEDMPFWEECYRNAFCDLFSDMRSYRNDQSRQRKGIDRGVILTDGREVTIDEKVRGRAKNGKVYEDIALEIGHKFDDGRFVAGWLTKDMQCDYVAYAIAPLGICYLLPLLNLRRAWKIGGKEWYGHATRRELGFEFVNSTNRCKKTGRQWTTQNIAVQPGFLLHAITQSMSASFTPCEAKA